MKQSFACFYFLSIFLIITTCQFTQTATCTATAGSCVIVCSSVSYPLTSVFSSDGGTTRRFYSTTDTNYRFIVPLCGANPTVAGNVPSFSSYDAIQGTTTLFGLGKMSLTSWFRGTYSSSVAFKASYTNGLLSGACTAPRTATIFFVCDVGFTVAAPQVVATEPSTCNCESPSRKVFLSLPLIFIILQIKS